MTIVEAGTDVVKQAMKETNELKKVRIGMVNYINTAPIYEIWKQKKSNPDWLIHEAPPAVLNTMLRAGELDLGVVSCWEYAARPELYTILPDLSISTNGPVGSVSLFSNCPIPELHKHRILLSNQSKTSAALAKIVLEKFYGVQPSYISGDVWSEEASGCSAVLAIGDNALRLKQDERYPHQLDLGQSWKENTGLPFVFAVWAVRKEFSLRQPQILAQIYRQLLECRKEGDGRLYEICGIVAPRIPMEVEMCHNYLKGIEYDLGQDKITALETFFEFLIKRKDADDNALPLHIQSF